MVIEYVLACLRARVYTRTRIRSLKYKFEFLKIIVKHSQALSHCTITISLVMLLVHTIRRKNIFIKEYEDEDDDYDYYENDSIGQTQST